MLAPAKSWIESKNVQTLLARVRSADFMAVSHRPIVGPEVTAWGCATWRGHRFLVALEALRNKAIAAKHGTFGEAWAAGGEAAAREFVKLTEAMPSTQDALVSVLGEPVLVGRMAA